MTGLLPPPKKSGNYLGILKNVLKSIPHFYGIQNFNERFGTFVSDQDTNIAIN